jgi:hypothetical protein
VKGLLEVQLGRGGGVGCSSCGLCCCVYLGSRVFLGTAVTAAGDVFVCAGLPVFLEVGMHAL